MAIGPRLELRQGQSLVMTPQLRQAIKLLQFSNLEVAAFVEEELERNPLLERDDRRRRAGAERAALDQIARARPNGADTAELARADTLPDAAGMLRSMPSHADSYDAGGPADGGPRPRRARRRLPISPRTSAASTDIAEARRQPARASRRAAAAEFRRSGGPDDRRASDRAALPRRAADRRSGGDRQGHGVPLRRGSRRCARA